MDRDRIRQASQAGLILLLTVGLTGCVYLLPRTADVLAPVEADLTLALAADFEALVSAIMRILGFLGFL